jgi:hypothetical protein
MHESTTQGGLQRPSQQPASGSRRSAAAPSSSRMFASYLNDVEQLIDEHRWELAQREAFDLPRLAVALSDPRLHCSAEQVTTWCQEWVRPQGAEHDAQGLDFERLGRRLVERSTELVGAEPVPMRALRRLQLRRHVRMLPRRFIPERSVYLTPREAETAEMCSALLEAGARWYARRAVHDPVVQGNLARLAVLR